LFFVLFIIYVIFYVDFDVDLVFMKPHSTKGHSDPTELAERTQTDVESVFKPVPPA